MNMDHSKTIQSSVYTSPSDFMNLLEEKNGGQSNFLEAVEEVIESIWPIIEEEPIYKEANILERLTEPERTIIFRVPWLDDQGVVQVNRGFRVEFNSAIGPYKGGLRFHPSVTLDVVKFLGFEQILKNSLTTLPVGGGKGGADFSSKGKSDQEVMRFCQSFMTELYRHIGYRTDVPAGDIGVGAREIGYLFGHYKRIVNKFDGTFTGKGAHWGGSKIRAEATGYGLVFFVIEMLSHRNESIEGKKVAISGSGNVAQFAAEKAIELGAQVITLSDSGGLIHFPDGLKKDQLEEIKELKNIKRGRLAEFADEHRLSFEEESDPWRTRCDVALPCATENEISGEDAKFMIEHGVLCVAEGSNKASTPKALRKFQESKVLFGPGKAANAGGVAVSGLEMSQNMMLTQWNGDKVERKLQGIMKQIHDKCVEHGSTTNGTDYIKGANIAGFIKVADAMIDQGVV